MGAPRGDMALFEQIGIYAFLLLLVVAGANDVMSQRIPNWIVIALTVSFLAFAGITRMPVVTMGMHLVVGLMLLCVGYALFALGVIGGGDAKLLASVGLWLGYPVVLSFLLYTALAGGGLAAAIGLWSAIQFEAEARGGKKEQVASRFAPDLPYGFAIASGGILASPLSWLMAGSAGQT